MAVAAEQLSMIRASLDPAGYVAGARQIEASNERITASGEKVNRTGEVTKRALENTERAIDRVRTRNDLLYKSQQDLARAQELYNKAVERGSSQAATLLPIIENLRLRTEKLAQANAGVTNAFGVTSRQAQQLAPQINDVITSLLGGASAFQVMTQQGGQITQAMGGVGNTFRALASNITATRVVVVGLTAAIAASALAFGSTEARIARLQNQLRATRSDYETFARDLDARSRAQAPELLPFTLNDTRSVQARLAASLPTDVTSNGGLERLTRLAADLSRTLDDDATKAADRLTRAFGSTTRAAEELSERGIRGFNEAFTQHLRLLESSGEYGQAYIDFVGRLETAVGGARDNIRGTEAASLNLRKAWENLTSSISERLTSAGEPMIRWLGDVERGAQRAGAALDIIYLAMRGGASMFSGNMGASNNLGGLLTDLVMQRINGGGSSSTASPASVSAVRRGFVPIASQDLPPEARAFLDTIAGPESGGRYDVRWGGMAGPQTITDLSRHPNIREPGPAGPSSAAGRYQITGSNWYGANGRPGLADRYGASDFSPQTQDRVAWSWAQDTYRQQTGRDLLEDLRNPQQHGTIAGALGGSSMWHTLNMGRYAANLAANGGPSPAAAAGAPSTAAATTPAAREAAAAAAAAETAQGRGDQALLRSAAGSRSDREAEINARITAYENLRNRIMQVAEAEGRDLTPEETRNVRNLNEAIQQQVAARNQLEESTERSIRVGREQLDVLRQEPGVQREVAQALQQAREQARSEGRALSVGDEREVERQTIERIALARQEETRATERQIVAENGIASAYQRSIEAGREAEARARAREMALRSEAIPGTAEFNRIVEENTRLLLRNNAAQAERQLAQGLAGQQMQLDLLREENNLIGLNTEERERRLAVMRAEQQVRMQGGNPSTGAGAMAVRNARDLTAEQQAQRWNQEAEGYGRQMGSAVSKYLYEGIVEGSWRGVRSLEQSLLQIGWQGLVAKPLETALSSLVGGAMGGTGSSPGLMQQIGTGAASALSGAGNWLTSASTWSWLTGAVVAHEGGWVGGISPSRAVPASAAGNVRRYHSGGGPGAALAPRELHAILTDDEVVLNGRQQRRAADRLTGGSRQRPVVMNFHVKDAPSLVQGKAQVARAASGFLRGAQRHG